LPDDQLTQPLFFDAIDAIVHFACIRFVGIMPESSDDSSSSKFRQSIETRLRILKEGFLPPNSIFSSTQQQQQQQFIHASYSKTFKTSTQKSSSQTNHTKTQNVSLPKIPPDR
jgi:hypothetical protein